MDDHELRRIERASALAVSSSEYSDVAPAIVEGMRNICLGLPETTEKPAWAGVQFRIRNRTFAHVVAIDSPDGSTTVVTFRSSGDELDALRSAGHPFFTPGWGTNTVGMILDGDLDWDEVAELLTESYCVLAPKKLVALVDRPTD